MSFEGIAILLWLVGESASKVVDRNHPESIFLECGDEVSEVICPADDSSDDHYRDMRGAFIDVVHPMPAWGRMPLSGKGQALFPVAIGHSSLSAGYKSLVEEESQEADIQDVSGFERGDFSCGSASWRHQRECRHKVEACPVPHGLEGFSGWRQEFGFVDIHLFARKQDIFAGISKILDFRGKPPKQPCLAHFVCAAVGSGDCPVNEGVGMEVEDDSLLADCIREVYRDIQAEDAAAIAGGFPQEEAAV